MRGSDPNAAVYWLARMIAGGEDVKFIARRMLIFASEDIGNANPNALLLANSTFQAVNVIGYPESQLILSQCAIYLASSAKSNSATLAIGEAMNAVQQLGDLPVPLHIRNAPTKMMKQMNYGKDYKYAHLYDNNFILQEFLPDAVKGRTFYSPQKNAREEELRKFLKERWKDKYGY
jgi:putative ATPase